MTEPTALVDQATLVKRGYNSDVAEALEGREITWGTLGVLTTDEVFEHYLEWNGIIGYSSQIRDALDNIRNMEAI